MAQKENLICPSTQLDELAERGADTIGDIPLRGILQYSRHVLIQRSKSESEDPDSEEKHMDAVYRIQEVLESFENKNEI